MARPIGQGVKRRVQLRIDPQLIESFDGYTSAQQSELMNQALAAKRGESMVSLSEHIEDAMRRSRDSEPAPIVPPSAILELARHSPAIHSALTLFMNGSGRYEDSLAVAVKALYEENQRLMAMNLELLDRVPPPPIPTQG